MDIVQWIKYIALKDYCRYFFSNDDNRNMLCKIVYIVAIGLVKSKLNSQLT